MCFCYEWVLLTTPFSITTGAESTAAASKHGQGCSCEFGSCAFIVHSMLLLVAGGGGSDSGELQPLLQGLLNSSSLRHCTCIIFASSLQSFCTYIECVVVYVLNE